MERTETGASMARSTTAITIAQTANGPGREASESTPARRRIIKRPIGDTARTNFWILQSALVSPRVLTVALGPSILLVNTLSRLIQDAEPGSFRRNMASGANESDRNQRAGQGLSAGPSWDQLT
jgi:hypothetical protein